MNKINIGSGEDIREGWTNLDKHNKHGADCIFDLEEIYKGEKLPFPDNHFDYVYCSHVIEDFINPMVLIEEFIRICKIGGRIELRTPFETNANNTNIYHQSIFTLGKFNSVASNINHYDANYKLEIEKLCYYDCSDVCPGISLRGKFLNLVQKFNTYLFNLIDYRIVESTFIKYILCYVNCRVVYVKLDVLGRKDE